MDITKKNVLITGANRGIGLEFAKKAAQLGAHVHLLCRKKNNSIENDLSRLGAASVQTWLLDLSQPKDIDRFIEQFKDSGNPPDILINNAGQLTGGLLENQPIADIYQMFQVNLVGLIHLTRSLLPSMLKLEKAKIVNNSSVSGLMHLPCATTYAASKAGVIAFTESLRNELKDSSVSTLVLVTPGVKTRMFEEISDLYSNNVDLKFVSSIPASQWAKRCFDHILKDKTVCSPTGMSYLGAKLGQHMPGVLGWLASGYFKR